MKFLLLLLTIILPLNALSESRIKDIVYFEGVRENMLMGYGLVVGLNGTGDNLKNSAFTEKGLTDFLERLGINTRGANLKTKNVAAVTITASLPPFARTGSRLTVNVHTIGDAKSLKGGTLLATPMLGADGEVYALAQGPLSIGIKPPDSPGKVETSNPTAGFIENGGIIEREIDFALQDLTKLNLALKNPDISTARSIETAINAAMRANVAIAKDPGTIEVVVSDSYTNNVVGFLADIENITVIPDTVAKIIIDEATGTIVIGDNVNVSNVAIAQGNLIVKVNKDKQFLFDIGMLGKERPTDSKPGEEIGVLPETTKLSDLVEGLNSLGVRPKDLVSILKSIKQAGALQAEIETR